MNVREYFRMLGSTPEDREVASAKGVSVEGGVIGCFGHTLCTYLVPATTISVGHGGVGYVRCLAAGGLRVRIHLKPSRRDPGHVLHSQLLMRFGVKLRFSVRAVIGSTSE